MSQRGQVIEQDLALQDDGNVQIMMIVSIKILRGKLLTIYQIHEMLVRSISDGV